MNTNLVTIADMFVAVPSARLPQSRPAHATNAKQLHPVRQGEPDSPYDAGTEKSDNVQVGTNTQPVGEHSPTFGHTLGKKTAPQKSPQTADKTKHRTQPTTSPVVAAASSAHATSARKAHITTELLAKVITTKGNSPRTDPRLGLKTSHKPAQLTNSRTITGPKPAFARVFKSPIPTNTNNNESQNAPKVTTAKGQNSAGKGILSQKSAPGVPLATVIAGIGRQIPPDKKSEVSQTITTLDGSKKPVSQLSVNPAHIRSKSTDAVRIPGKSTDAAQIPKKSTDAVQVPGKSTVPTPAVQLGLNRPALIANRPTDNKAGAGQRQLQSTSSNSKKPSDNLSNNSAPLNVKALKPPTPRDNSKYRNHSSPKQNTDHLTFQRLSSLNDAQPRVSQPSSTAAQTTKHADSALPTTPQSVGQQIMESIHSSMQQGDRQIIIRLNPPELGEVSVKFQEQESQITGLLEVSKLQTRFEIEQALPQIIRNLQDSGVQVRRLEVMAPNQPEPETGRDQTLPDGSFQHHHPAEQGNPDANPATEWLAAASDNSSSKNSEPQVLVTDDSINVLI